MFKPNNRILKIFLKSIALLMIQAFLFLDLAFCPEANELFSKTQDSRISCLSPRLSVDISAFQRAYVLYQSASVESLFFNRILSDQQVQDNGVEINSNTINITLGKKQFKVPPYLAGRVKRVHVTDFSAKGFTFQKLGIGLGRRKKTKAVILVDLEHPDNQIIFFEDKENIKLKKLASGTLAEDIKLGRDSQFAAMQRQDSVLEKTQIGKVFLDTVLGIDNSSLPRARQVVAVLKKLANDNSKLKSSLPVNLAFFSKDYILTFSRELRKHSFITVLKDRPQRGRFIAIIDELDPDNFVVFERKGNQVFVLGKSEKPLIASLTKQQKAKSYYFTDIQQGADFCRNVSRSLVSYRVSDQNNSFSLRKGMQLHLGSDNRDIGILKVNQVTQATPTGYQIKQRPSALDQLILASYPIYLLDPAYVNKKVLISDFSRSDLLFFDHSRLESYPEYLSIVKHGNLMYLRKIQEDFFASDGKYVVYAKIPDQDIISKINFAEQGIFTIKGINWNNGNPVRFRNIKQLSMPVIITQLSGSKHIKIDNALRDRFFVNQIIGTPYRITLKFNKGFFEQANTVFINSADDWKKIQKQADINIKKFQSKNKAGLNSIAGICALIFAKLCLFPSISEAANRIGSLDTSFIDTFISGATLIAAISIFRYFKMIRDIGLEQKTLKFNPKRSEFPKDARTKNQIAASGVFASIIIGADPLSGAKEAVKETKTKNRPPVSRKGKVPKPKDLDNQRKEKVSVPGINPIKTNDSRLGNTDIVTISEQARQLYSFFLVNQSI
ncbi:MAG: hypothetical protein KJ915_06720 [Candidatus Omnitrophica bacterium]|nr:hypothetical protein [Candidatus Omnitrophota bacterium]